MQVMGLVAREKWFLGGQYLTELCDPAAGIQYGILHLKKKIG